MTTRPETGAHELRRAPAAALAAAMDDGKKHLLLAARKSIPPLSHVCFVYPNEITQQVALSPRSSYR
jgi:hypothetical protein